MTYQDFMDLLDEEIDNSIKAMINGEQENFIKYQAQINTYKHLKIKIKTKLEKEAKNAVAKR